MSISEKKSDPADPAQTTLSERQARELAASLDAASDDLERNGPVPPTTVRRTLLDLYAELGKEKTTG